MLSGQLGFKDIILCLVNKAVRFVANPNLAFQQKNTRNAFRNGFANASKCFFCGTNLITFSLTRIICLKCYVLMKYFISLPELTWYVFKHILRN